MFWMAWKNVSLRVADKPSSQIARNKAALGPARYGIRCYRVSCQLSAQCYNTDLSVNVGRSCPSSFLSEHRLLFISLIEKAESLVIICAACIDWNEYA